MKTAILICLTFISLQLAAQTKSKSATLELRIPGAAKNDTLRLEVWPKGLSPLGTRLLPSKEYIAINKNGNFRFKIDSLYERVYFTAKKDPQPIRAGEYTPIFSYLSMEPGDNVVVTMDSLIPIVIHFPELGDVIQGYRKVNMSFSGKGSAKYEFMANLEDRTNKWLEKRNPRRFDVHKTDSSFYVTLPTYSRNVLNYTYETYTYQSDLLKEYKSKMSTEDYNVLRAELAGILLTQNIRSFTANRSMYRYDTTVTQQFKDAMTDTLTSIYNARKKPAISDIPEELLSKALNYIEYLTSETYYIEKDQYFALVKNYKEGILRDKVIADLLLTRKSHLKKSNDVLADAVSKVNDDYYLTVVSNIYKANSVGSTAYNFELPDKDGKMIRLSDLKGKIVFLDLWYTGCGACAGFYKFQLSKVEKYFENNPDVVFITISIDSAKELWLKSLKGGTYTSPESHNVINLYTDGQGAEHPLIKAYNIIGYPTPFMVDNNGKIYRMSNLRGPVEELISIINEALAKNKKAF